MNYKSLIVTTLLMLTYSISSNVEAKKKKEDPLLVLEFEAPKPYKPKNKRDMTKQDKALAKNYKEVETMLSKCAIKISEFEDRRQNKQTIGSTFWKPLKIAPVETFLEQASEEMLRKNLMSDAVGERLITVEPKLTRMYSYAQNMNIHGVIALHVDFRENGKIIDSRHYRALGSTINWNNGEHEFLDSINTSMQNVLPKVLFDLPTLCKSDTLDFTPHELK